MSEVSNVSSRRYILRTYRWGLYLLVPGKLHIVVHPWYFHACRAR